MKFGICTGVENAALLKKIGYDYFEPGFANFGKMTDDEYKSFCDAVAKAGIKPEATNLMLPGTTYRIVGEEVDLAPVKDFLELCFARAAGIGCETVVFGSSGAKKVPDGFDRAKAYDQIEDYLRLAAPIAQNNNITIAIEPLRFAECNIINFVAEAAYMAARVDHPYVRVLGDYYHIAMNREDCEALPAFAHRLEHMHIARNGNRAYPLPGDGCDYAVFMNALKQAGYRKRVSIEGKAENGLEVDAEKALELLKSLD